MNRLIVLLIGTSLIMLTGCATNVKNSLSKLSDVPVPIAYLRTNQLKMQAARHWDVLAQYEAERIHAAIKYLSKPIYIDPPNTSSFAYAYHAMLQTHLVEKGATLAIRPLAEGVKISYQTQVLEHRGRGYAEKSWIPNFLGGRSDSTWDYGNSGYYYDSGNPGWRWGWSDSNYDDGPSNGWGGGYNRVNRPVGMTEVIITTQVLDGGLVLYSSTNVFYYNPGDTEHYHTVQGRNATFTMVDQPSGGTYGSDGAAGAAWQPEAAGAAEGQQPEEESSWQ